MVPSVETDDEKVAWKRLAEMISSCQGALTVIIEGPPISFLALDMAVERCWEETLHIDQRWGDYSCPFTFAGSSDSDKESIILRGLGMTCGRCNFSNTRCLGRLVLRTLDASTPRNALEDD